MAQVTVYLADDVVEEVERLRTVQHLSDGPGMGVPSRTKVLEQIVWDGLPANSRLTINRARRAKREELDDD